METKLNTFTSLSTSFGNPDISPAAALYQVSRVAAALHLSKDAVESLVQAHIQARQFGVLD
jgi:potassium-transporting ATPase KdpC subunit